MPKRKTSTKSTSSSGRKNKTSKSASVRSLAEASELSYDTQLIITVLLLIFIYPLGVIFMWAWMRTWPVWLKLILTLPVFAFLLCVFFIMFILRAAFRDANYRTWVMEHRHGNNVYIQLPTPTGSNGSTLHAY